ncbi:hypothetical protein IIC65_02700 [Candidatus Sumerlaeota bacterium]|nr:hypothetical protein [Candidatus Sumerlaeota bacterium]
MADASRDYDERLGLEARRFAWYLLRREPPQQLVQRYVQACRLLFPHPLDRSDQQVIDFAVTRPWSVPLLDAATGLRRPDAPLRRKILLMAALLEASPFGAEDFMPRRCSRTRLFLELASCGLAAAVKVVLGFPLLGLARFAKPGFSDHGADS